MSKSKVPDGLQRRGEKKGVDQRTNRQTCRQAELFDDFIFRGRKWALRGGKPIFSLVYIFFPVYKAGRYRVYIQGKGNSSSAAAINPFPSLATLRPFFIIFELAALALKKPISIVAKGKRHIQADSSSLSFHSY